MWPFHEEAKALHKRSAFFSILLVCVLTAALAIVWFGWAGKGIHVFRMQMVHENRDAWIQPVAPGDEISHKYIHSVEKCPIIEKYIVDGEHRLMLQESWNCSFGAGIAHDKGEAKGSFKEGFYVIEGIGDVHGSIYMQPAGFTDHTLTVASSERNLSEEFPDTLLLIEIATVPQWKVWLHTKFE
jgi:hypothetical protein